MGSMNHLEMVGLLLSFPQYEVAQTTGVNWVIERMGHVVHRKLFDLFCLQHWWVLGNAFWCDFSIPISDEYNWNTDISRWFNYPISTFEPWWPHYQAIYFEEFRYCNRPMVNLLLSIFVNSLFSNFLLGLISTIFQLFVGLTTAFPSWQSNSIQIRNSPFFVG